MEKNLEVVKLKRIIEGDKVIKHKKKKRKKGKIKVVVTATNIYGQTTKATCTITRNGITGNNGWYKSTSATYNSSKSSTQGDKAGNSSSTSRTFKVKTWVRYSSCGVELYKSCAHSECEIESYNECEDSTCGIKTYKTCAKEICGNKTYRTSDCGIERYKESWHY